MVAAGDLEKPKIEIQVWYLEVDPRRCGRRFLLSHQETRIDWAKERQEEVILLLNANC